MNVTTLKKTILANALPKELQKEWELVPDQQVTISVETEAMRRKKLQELRQVMAEMGKEAQEAGLTEEKIYAILQEYKKTRRA